MVALNFSYEYKEFPKMGLCPGALDSGQHSEGPLYWRLFMVVFLDGAVVVFKVSEQNGRQELPPRFEVLEGSWRCSMTSLKTNHLH